MRAWWSFAVLVGAAWFCGAALAQQEPVLEDEAPAIPPVETIEKPVAADEPAEPGKKPASEKPSKETPGKQKPIKEPPVKENSGKKPYEKGSPEKKPLGKPGSEKQPPGERMPKKQLDQKQPLNGQKIGGQKSGQREKWDKNARLTGEREEAALGFAREHHPELATLIETLREQSPEKYSQALQEVAHASERLQALRDKRPERYELELKDWTLNSQIRLLAARTGMKTADPEQDAQLRELLGRQIDLRREHLELEKKDLAAHLQRIDEQLQHIETDRDKVIDREFARLRRDVGGRARKLAEKKRQDAKDGRTKGLVKGDEATGDEAKPLGDKPGGEKSVEK